MLSQNILITLLVGNFGKRKGETGRRGRTQVLLLELAGQVTLDEGGLACDSGGKRCVSVHRSGGGRWRVLKVFFCRYAAAQDLQRGGVKAEELLGGGRGDGSPCSPVPPSPTRMSLKVGVCAIFPCCLGGAEGGERKLGGASSPSEIGAERRCLCPSLGQRGKNTEQNKHSRTHSFRVSPGRNTCRT